MENSSVEFPVQWDTPAPDAAFSLAFPLSCQLHLHFTSRCSSKKERGKQCNCMTDSPVK